MSMLLKSNKYLDLQYILDRFTIDIDRLYVIIYVAININIKISYNNNNITIL